MKKSRPTKLLWNKSFEDKIKAKYRPYSLWFQTKPYDYVTVRQNVGTQSATKGQWPLPLWLSQLTVWRWRFFPMQEKWLLSEQLWRQKQIRDVWFDVNLWMRTPWRKHSLRNLVIFRDVILASCHKSLNLPTMWRNLWMSPNPFKIE